MSRPWLSVIVPTYNGSQYLATALESIEFQQDRNIEVLAVDDGSSDGSREILRAFASRLPLEIIERAHQGNWVAAVNAGLARARGRYLCLLHQDDICLPKRLERLRGLASKWPAAALLVHPCWYMNAAGRRIGYWHCALPRRDRPLSAREVVPPLLVQCSIGTPAPLFRADAAAGVGPMDEDLWYSADWDYWLRLAAIGRTICFPTPLAAFRIHRGSQTLSRADLPDEIERQQRVVLDRHLPAWRRELSDGGSLAREATFSADVNVELAKFAHGRRVAWGALARGLLALPPSDWRRYFRDSPTIERCLSRVKAVAVRRRGVQAVLRAAVNQTFLRHPHHPSAAPTTTLDGNFNRHSSTIVATFDPSSLPARPSAPVP